jgi:uncharacterized membrane protein YidH (DUF202 family)
MDRTMAFQMGRFLVIAGIILVIVGLILMSGGRWHFFGLGRLPGDINYRGRNVHIYFPLVTCIIASLAVTLLLWVVSFFTRK